MTRDVTGVWHQVERSYFRLPDLSSFTKSRLPPKAALFLIVSICLKKYIYIFPVVSPFLDIYFYLFLEKSSNKIFFVLNVFAFNTINIAEHQLTIWFDFSYEPTDLQKQAVINENTEGTATHTHTS